MTDAQERRPAVDELGEPIGANEQQSSVLRSTAQASNQFDRGCVAPVQVFEHDDERCHSGERFNRVNQFPGY